MIAIRRASLVLVLLAKAAAFAPFMPACTATKAFMVGTATTQQVDVATTQVCIVRLQTYRYA
jgi:hypothetical protein